jgi:hypothetical protein
MSPDVCAETSGAVGASLCCRNRDSQDAGGLGHRQLFDIMQNRCGPIVSRKSRDDRAQHIAKLSSHGRIVDVGPPVADEARMAPILIERRQNLV